MAEPFDQPDRFEGAPVLLVEDSEDDVFLIRRTFQKAGFTNPLAIVPDGEQAVAYLQGTGPYADRRRHPVPVLILLDLNLPRLGGLEVLVAARRLPEARIIPIYVLSASNRKTDVVRALEAGANAYLVKPSRVEQLVELARAVREFARFQAFPSLIAARPPAEPSTETR